MSDHIENEGKKGRFMMWLIIYFVLFVSLLIRGAVRNGGIFLSQCV